LDTVVHDLSRDKLASRNNHESEQNHHISRYSCWISLRRITDKRS
jgi:hypothetical protein